MDPSITNPVPLVRRARSVRVLRGDPAAPCPASPPTSTRSQRAVADHADPADPAADPVALADHADHDVAHAVPVVDPADPADRADRALSPIVGLAASRCHRGRMSRHHVGPALLVVRAGRSAIAHAGHVDPADPVRHRVPTNRQSADPATRVPLHPGTPTAGPLVPAALKSHAVPADPVKIGMDFNVISILSDLLDVDAARISRCQRPVLCGPCLCQKNNIPKSCFKNFSKVYSLLCFIVNALTTHWL